MNTPQYSYTLKSPTGKLVEATAPAAARVLDLSPATIHAAYKKSPRPMRNGWAVLKRTLIQEIIIYKGERHTKASLGRALGIDGSTVTGHLLRGSISNAGKGINWDRKIRVRVNGIEYESMSAAARLSGVGKQGLTHRYRKGLKYYTAKSGHFVEFV